MRRARLDTRQIVAALVATYVLAAAFTHPLLPGSDGIAATGRGLRSVIYLREGALALIFAAGLVQATARGLWHVHLFALYAGFLLVLAVIEATVPVVFGVRSVVTIGAALVLPFMVQTNPLILRHAARALKVVIASYVVLALVQLATLPPFYGATFLGPRVFAASSSPLHLAFTAGAASVFFATQSRSGGGWVLACLFLALASGGRAGMLIALVGVSALFAGHLRSTLPARVIGFQLLAVLLVVAAFVVSMPELSGRSGTAGGPLEDARLRAWSIALSDWSRGSVGELLFGSGLGVGSNASAAFVESFTYTDSTLVFLILSYGLLGAMLVMGSMVWTLVRLCSPFALIAWAITALTQLVFELHPVSLIPLLCLKPSLVSARLDPAGRGARRGSGRFALSVGRRRQASMR